jgi:hypothetical protein
MGSGMPLTAKIDDVKRFNQHSGIAIHREPKKAWPCIPEIKLLK